MGSRFQTIFITANGVWPYVDFQGVGLYDGNTLGPGGTQVDFTPVTSDSAGQTHLNGSVSLQNAFVGLKARSDDGAGGAPVVVFIDWPTSNMTRYQALPLSEKEDYWRLYAAEAYANGLFFAFFLADTTGEATATQSGLMPFFQGLAGFYRSHATLYHQVTRSVATVATSLPAPSVMVAVADQAQPPRRIVHLVNHQYQAAFLPQSNVVLTIPVPAAPSAVTLASPDMAQDQTLSPSSYAGGLLTVTVPSLTAYDVIVVAY
jgi:hypothetical protein